MSNSGRLSAVMIMILRRLLSQFTSLEISGA